MQISNHDSDLSAIDVSLPDLDTTAEATDGPPSSTAATGHATSASPPPMDEMNTAQSVLHSISGLRPPALAEAETSGAASSVYYIQVRLLRAMLPAGV